MESLIKSDIFFFITSISVVLVTVLVLVILFYIFRIVKNVKDISDAVRERGMVVLNDVGKVHEFIRRSGLSVASKVAKMFFGSNTRRDTKNNRKNKKQ